MNVAKLYEECSIIAQRDAKHAIEKIKNVVVWKENCNVFEVGCGPGNITHNFLLPVLPKSTISVTGIDKNADVIKYAQEKYGKTSIITFKQMDIVKDRASLIAYVNHFDYIFSFYCFHFIYEQEEAFRNIYNTLKPGGDFFFSLITRNDLCDLLDHMGASVKWGKCLSPYKEAIWQHHTLSDPKEVVEQLLLKLGFKVLHLSTEPRDYIFCFKAIREFLLTHIPIDLPENLQNEFCLDFWDLMQTSGFNLIEMGEERFRCKYVMIFVHVTKEL